MGNVLLLRLDDALVQVSQFLLDHFDIRRALLQIQLLLQNHLIVLVPEVLYRVDIRGHAIE